MELCWISLSFVRRRAPLNIQIKSDKFCQIAELCEIEVK